MPNRPGVYGGGLPALPSRPGLPTYNGMPDSRDGLGGIKSEGQQAHDMMGSIAQFSPWKRFQEERNYQGNVDRTASNMALPSKTMNEINRLLAESDAGTFKASDWKVGAAPGEAYQPRSRPGVAPATTLASNPWVQDRIAGPAPAAKAPPAPAPAAKAPEPVNPDPFPFQFPSQSPAPAQAINPRRPRLMPDPSRSPSPVAIPQRSGPTPGLQMTSFDPGRGRIPRVQIPQVPRSAPQPGVGASPQGAPDPFRQMIVADLESKANEAMARGDHTSAMEFLAQKGALDTGGYVGHQRYMLERAGENAKLAQLGVKQGAPAGTAPTPENSADVLAERYGNVKHLFTTDDKGVPNVESLARLYHDAAAIGPTGFDDPNSEFSKAAAARIRQMYGSRLGQELYVPEAPTGGSMGVPLLSWLKNAANGHKQFNMTESRAFHQPAVDWYNRISR